MLYVVYSQDYSDFSMVGLYEGPAGLDLVKMFDDFVSNFDHRTLGTYEYPKYEGPLTKPVASSLGSGVVPSIFASGFLSIIYTVPGVAYSSPDTSSPEYAAWQQKCNSIRIEYDRRADEKVAEFRLKYPGDGNLQMFVSYLKTEHFFREVEHTPVNL